MPGGGRQWKDKNFYANYGGIPKNVRLHVTDKLHQTLPLYSKPGTIGVYVYAQEFDIKGRSAKSHRRGPNEKRLSGGKKFSYEVSITDAGGNAVSKLQGGELTIAPGETKTVTASGKVCMLNVWSWGYGQRPPRWDPQGRRAPLPVRGVQARPRQRIQRLQLLFLDRSDELEVREHRPARTKERHPRS